MSCSVSAMHSFFRSQPPFISTTAEVWKEVDGNFVLVHAETEQGGQWIRDRVRSIQEGSAAETIEQVSMGIHGNTQEGTYGAVVRLGEEIYRIGGHRQQTHPFHHIFDQRMVMMQHLSASSVSEGRCIVERRTGDAPLESREEDCKSASEELIRFALQSVGNDQIQLDRETSRSALASCKRMTFSSGESAMTVQSTGPSILIRSAPSNVTLARATPSEKPQTKTQWLGMKKLEPMVKV